MQFQLNEDLIRDLVIAHVNSKITVNEGVSVNVSFKTLRGVEGFMAIIDLTGSGEAKPSVVPKRATRQPRQPAAHVAATPAQDPMVEEQPQPDPNPPAGPEDDVGPGPTPDPAPEPEAATTTGSAPDETDPPFDPDAEEAALKAADSTPKSTPAASPAKQAVASPAATQIAGARTPVFPGFKAATPFKRPGQ